MRTANIKYARDHFRALIDEVAEGEEVVVTRRGEPVARLVPIDKEPQRLPNLESFRSSIQVQGKALSQDIVAAREDERY